MDGLILFLRQPYEGGVSFPFLFFFFFQITILQIKNPWCPDKLGNLPKVTELVGRTAHAHHSWNTQFMFNAFQMPSFKIPEIYFFEWKFCLDTCPGVGLLDNIVVLYLVFWGTSILFSIVVAPISIPTNSEREGSLFSAPPPAFVICWLVNDGQFEVWGGISL